MVCRRCLVSGHVQGVYFRASTREHALALGVSGYARNLRDGRVEVLACGPEEAVGALCRWLSDGPPGARVSEVRCESYTAVAPSTFQIV
jgi:acylphosphatase